MSNAITMGILWHLIGAASAACFYAPFKKVKHWSWETMWSVGGIVSSAYPSLGQSARCYCLIFGPISARLMPPRCCRCSCSAQCGIGNINYGLTMRYTGHVDGHWYRHRHYADCRYADDADHQR